MSKLYFLQCIVRPLLCRSHKIKQNYSENSNNVSKKFNLNSQNTGGCTDLLIKIQERLEYKDYLIKEYIKDIPEYFRLNLEEKLKRIAVHINYQTHITVFKENENKKDIQGTILDSLMQGIFEINLQISCYTL